MQKNKKNSVFLKKLQNCESPNITYIDNKFPIVMAKGKGLIIKDLDGNRYKDFTSCFGVLALGHQHPVVVKTARKQISQLIHGMGDVHPSNAKINLLATLKSIAPFSDSKAILGQNGSDAVEAALKTAMLITGRSKFISFSGGYHGLSFGPLALTNKKIFTEGFDAWLQEKAIHIPFPLNDFTDNQLICSQIKPKVQDLFVKEQGALSATIITMLEDALKDKQIAAIVVEPLQGRGGERTWPQNFLKDISFLAKKYGTLIICDEIFTGFGRTGKLWAHEYLDFVPDIMCVGKAMGGGFPISACMSPLMDVWGKSGGEARHTSTFLGHPLTCAVANNVIKYLITHLPAFYLEFTKIEQEFIRFNNLCGEKGLGATHPFVVRGMGLMRGIYFFDDKPGFAQIVTENMLQKGYITLPSGTLGNVLSIIPPLNTSASEMRKFFNTLIEVLANI